MFRHSSLKQVPSSIHIMSWLRTREASTLTIVTFIVSTVFAFINDMSYRVTLYDIAPIGFVLSFLGIAYRQITVWSTDRIEHNQQFFKACRVITLTRADNLALSYDALQARNPHLIESMNIIERRTNLQVYLLWSEVRGFVLLWVFLLPVAFWLLILSCDHGSGNASSTTVYTIVLGALFSLILTDVDVGLRVRDLIKYINDVPQDLLNQNYGAS